MVQGRRLRNELRRARQDAHLTQQSVAEALDWSVSKLIRIERGSVGITVTDVRALLQHYEITDEQRVQRLVEMARTSRKPAWWTKYRHIFVPMMLTVLGFEASARVIRTYHGGVIPGLLQTEDYAHAVITAYGSPGPIDDAVSARLDRQQVIDRDDPPELFFVLDEAVIRRAVGGIPVMREQLVALKDAAERPNVHVQVIPFDAGAHPGMIAPFTVFEFPADDEDDYIVQLENITDSTLIRNDDGDAIPYVDRFFELEKQATPKEQINEVISEAIERLKSLKRVTISKGTDV